MATYSYEAMDSVGQPTKGTLDATDVEEAISKVRAMGHFPTKVKLKKGEPKICKCKSCKEKSIQKTKKRLQLKLDSLVAKIARCGFAVDVEGDSHDSFYFYVREK